MSEATKEKKRKKRKSFGQMYHMGSEYFMCWDDQVDV